MDDGSAYHLEVAPGLAEIAPADWNAIANPSTEPFDPFLTWEFLEALERSGCVAPETGWAARHLLLRGSGGRLAAAMPLYLKGHSYGEYVFDHAWADALHRAGGRYYPKLLCAIPFTPVSGRRLLAADGSARAVLVSGAIALAQRHRASSVHLNFLLPADLAAAQTQGLLPRTGVQFHWTNPGYASFEDFLSTLSSSRRKNLRRERARAAEAVSIERKLGKDLSERDWDVFFQCYLDTGSRKWGNPYLNRSFFELVGERLADSVVLFVAKRAGRIIACALNFEGGDCLYGRYWGRLEDHPFLHFELCYYQAIEYAIEKGLSRVEAGAQGEHKLARGYGPVSTHSAHWIANPSLRQAVAAYLQEERPAVAEEIEILAEQTPFRHSEGE